MSAKPDEITRAVQTSLLINELLPAITEGPREAVVALLYSLATTSVSTANASAMPSVVRAKLHEMLDTALDHVERAKATT